jgi:sulfoacetaldehyde acetyltransferase
MLEMGPAQLNMPRDYFYGDTQAAIPRPMRIGRGAGDPAALDEAAALLAAAKFPVILAGGGVIMAGGMAEAVALAELLHAPVCNSYLHNDSFPATHPLWCGPLGYQGSKAAMQLISQADVVLALGTRLGPFGTLPQYGMEYWPANARIIQVDADPRVLGLVKSISVGINGDARAAASALVERLAARELACTANTAERKARIEAEKVAWERELAAWTHERDPFSLEVAQHSKYMHPRQMLRELERAMPRHAMVATDIGNICSVSNSYLRFEEPRSMFAAMSFGNCGYAFPVICGAKIASPDRPAIAYVGDGAFGISLNELLTCAREKIGVTVVVFNNGQWGAEKKNHVDFYSRRFQAVNLESPSWAAVARAFGCAGVTVDQLSEVGPALRASVQAQAEGRTTVIEMMVTQELGDPFRRDALSRPVRYLEKYQAYT